jgi:hypothetical protein
MIRGWPWSSSSSTGWARAPATRIATRSRAATTSCRASRTGRARPCRRAGARSATGQTAILTGENAPRALGRHLLGFPNAPLREILERASLFRALAAAGRTGAFANAYPVAYLRALGIAAEGEAEFEVGRRRVRAAATTVAYAAAGGAFRTWADAKAGRGLTHDVTGRRARGFGADVPLREPEEAAEILDRLARAHDLALFEFFETDEAGHARSMERAEDALSRLDRFLRALLARLGPEDALVVASDHGNLEDLSTRNHTLAPVPVLGFGRAAAAIGGVRDLTHLAPLLLHLAGSGGLPPRPANGYI